MHLWFPSVELVLSVGSTCPNAFMSPHSPHACGMISPGSASDYGVQKALSETTLSMLQAHGATKAGAEKENTKVSRLPWLLTVLLETCMGSSEANKTT